MTDQLLALASLAGGEPRTLLAPEPITGDVKLLGRVRLNRAFTRSRPGGSHGSDRPDGFGDSAFGDGYEGNERDLFGIHEATTTRADLSAEWAWEDDSRKWGGQP